MQHLTEVDAILSGISDGFVSFDNDWRFTHVNAAAERLWGLPASGVVGRTVFEVLGIGADNPFHACYSESKRNGEPVAFAGRSGLRDAWFEVRGYPHAAGYSIFFRDVTEERGAHLALVETQRRLAAANRINRRIFETTLDLILVVDPRGTIIHVSPSTRALLGYAPEEMIGRSASEYLYPEDLDRTREEMRLARRGRAMRNFESRYVHKDGHPVQIAWTGTWSDADAQHFFIGRDMTERNAAEERLRRSQRLEAVGQLTGGLAHDFNNLLTVVIGNLDLLEESVAANPAAADHAARALKAATRGAALTKQLLAFARRQPLDAKVIDINERVTATMDLLRRTLGEEIEVTTALAPHLWPATADPSQLEAALVNLAINARDAMPKGGRLSIETANRRIDESDVARSFDAAAGDYVMLAVSDTGHGMPPEIISRVFEPFFTTKPAGKGTGLGLSMVYGFVRQSQGHVQIYSEVGHGTSVRIYLPRAAEGAAPVAAEPVPATMPRARAGERILAVEDNADVRRVVAAQLGELGYALTEAANGEAALDILKGGEAVHLLFTDVVMPGGMTGYDLARAARALRPDLRVLLTSGFARTASGEKSIGEFGALLVKPYRRAELAARIRQAIDGE